MKRIVLFLILVNLLITAPAQNALQQFVNNPALKHASVGVYVKDLNTGKIVANHNGDKSLTPASVLKLVTTATALETFGPEFTYTTTLALDADKPTRLLILGSGDPSLGSEAFKDNPTDFLKLWQDGVTKSLKLRKINEMYVVDNLFGYQGVSPEWTWVDMGNYYAAPAYGISVFDNTYKLIFDTTDKSSCPVILHTEPMIEGLKFTNYLTLNNSGTDNGYIYGAPFSYDREVRGNIPSGRSNFSIKGDIPDPGLLLGNTFSDILQNIGCDIQSVTTARNDYIQRICTKGPVRPCRAGETLYEHQSRPLSMLVREINVQSNNHYTEHLIRTIGRNQNSDIYSDALQEGIDYINKFWKLKGISTDPLFMEDGCGLAPQNAVSPAFLTNLLSYMYKDSKNSKVFFDSLPEAGEENSTLRNFMRGTKYAGKISAKSGSIGGVQCFSGYLIDGGKKYAFTVMVNKFNGARTEVRSAIEKYLLSL